MNTKFLLSSDNNNRNELLKKKIIHYYIANGDATIADLGREMDLSIPTVTKLVAELQDDGYILDFGKQETNGGRKPNIYGLNPASGYFVGVDMLKDKLNIAAIDFKGDKVQLEENIPYQLENTPASLEQFCKIIDDFIVSLPVERNKILAIGVNITGRVNPASGYSYSIFYFEEKPLAQILEERLQTKVFIENDSRAMTYGEYMKGVVQGEKNILFVNMAWGLGLGIIIDGNLYYGKSGFSGEFGHFCMFENEVLCHCGKKGCLETEASGKRPKAFMLTIGNLAMRQARAQYSCNFLACAGYEVVDNLGFSTVEEGIEAAMAAKADIVVLCSSDDEYAEYAVPAFKALNGRAMFIVAGAPACMDDLKAAGIENFIHVRVNVLETLKEFNAKLLK